MLIRKNQKFLQINTNVWGKNSCFSDFITVLRSISSMCFGATFDKPFAKVDKNNHLLICIIEGIMVLEIYLLFSKI